MASFTGTGYLGLQEDPGWLRLVQSNLERFGSNHPISRLNDHRDFEILHRLERHLAASTGSESACVFSSGYLAGIAVSRYFAERACDDALAMVFPANHHPCLAPPAGWQQHTLDWDGIDGLKALGTHGSVVFGQTVDLFDGEIDRALHSRLMAAATWRVLDCSHTMALWPHREMNTAPARTVFLGSLGKAGAFPAGFAAGPQAIIAAIQARGEYCAAAPPSLAFAAAYLDHAERRAGLRATLWRHLQVIDDALACRRERPFPVYRLGPIRDGLNSALEIQGLHLSWLRYPNPNSPLHLRAVIHATHRDGEIHTLLKALGEHRLHPEASPHKPDHWIAHFPQDAGSRFFQARKP